MKVCSTCRRELPLSEFSKKRLNRLQASCKECNRKYNKTHYQNNKDVYIKKAKVWDDRNRQANLSYLLEYLLEHPCVDCGESDPLVLEFDHLRDKTKNISTLWQAATWSTVLKEIEKCEVRCANCHRRKTAQQFGHLKLEAWFGGK